jgi:hypothetical protein
MSLSLLMSECTTDARGFPLAARPVRPQSGYQIPDWLSAIQMASLLNAGSIGLHSREPAPPLHM